MKKNRCCFSLRYIRLFPYLRLFPQRRFYIIMENAVNTNGRRKKVPVDLRHFFKHEKEERRSFLILIN